jgi:hypothetical protein
MEKQCPECGGEVRNWGSTERWGHKVTNYRCENHPEFVEGDPDEADTCDFDEPLLSDTFLREWHNTVPVTCPLCQAPFIDEDWEKSPTQIDAVEQVCDCCGTKTTIDIESNKYRRGMNRSNLAIQFFEDDDESRKNDTDNETTTSDPQVSTLQDFIQ